MKLGKIFTRAALLAPMVSLLSLGYQYPGDETILQQSSPPPADPLPPRITDTRMILAVMLIESACRRYVRNRVITSVSGAKGEMQVMDATNAEPKCTVTPAQNKTLDERARVGRDYIRQLRHDFETHGLACPTDHFAVHGNLSVFIPQRIDHVEALDRTLAAYNAGLGTVNNVILNEGDHWRESKDLPLQAKNYLVKFYKALDTLEQDKKIYNQCYALLPEDLKIRETVSVQNRLTP